MTHTQLDAAPPVLGSNPSFTALMSEIRGQVLLRGDAGYEQARRIWNGMIDRHPSLIVRCTGTADVIACVNFAREEGLPLAIRSGGHNVAGSAICEDGLVVDLSAMKGIGIDPARRMVHAQPGLLWGEFDGATQAFGLATTGGIVTHTGIAGLTLGGGDWLAHAPTWADLRQSLRSHRCYSRWTMPTHR